jgi:hypothetical protein
MKDIDLQKPIPCNCGHTASYNLHCRHVLSFLQCTDRLNNFSDYAKKWVPQRYHLHVYKEAYNEASIIPINPSELTPTFVLAPVFAPHPNDVFSVLPATQHATSTTTTTSVSPPPPAMIPQILPNDALKKPGPKRKKRIANSGSLAKDGGTTGGGKRARRRVDFRMTSSGGMVVPDGHNPNYHGKRKGRGVNSQFDAE